MADKNFNLWWNQQRRSLERVSYGIALDYNNVTGHNDNFTFGYQTGYNPSGTVFYKRPNLGRKQQHEVGFLFHRGKAREVNHITIADRKTFLSLQSFARFQTELKLFYSLRKNIYTRHNFTLAFTNEKVDDSVAKVNPNFLGNGQSRIFFPSVIYRFQFNNANNLLYPLKGKSVSAEFLHHGAGKKYGVNTTQLKIDANLYLPIGKGFYFTTGFLGKFFLPRRPAFLFTRGLGYDDRESFRGFDAFALDGNAYGVLKANVIKRLFSTTLNINFLPSTFRKIPFEFYLKGLMDGGYVVNPVPGNNVLVNRWLLNRGLSLDIVTFYDINISFEYNFNKYIGQGLFFRSKFGLF